jgi:pimeloyl-ACP methyl ester carboxylesterase
LASLYAHDYSEHVYKLGLLAPGFKTPVYTKVSEELVQGKFEKFVPSNSRDLATMIDLYCCNKPQYYSYPEVLLEAVMRVQYSPEQQKLLRNRKFHLQVLKLTYAFIICVFMSCLVLSNCVVEQDSKFESDFKVKIQLIKTRTIIIWGENDEMIHISGAYQLRDLIQNSELKILKNCNHMIHLDQPQEAIKHLLDFF